MSDTVQSSVLFIPSKSASDRAGGRSRGEESYEVVHFNTRAEGLANQLRDFSRSLNKYPTVSLD